MRATFYANNPADIEYTLTVTMPLRNWEALRDILPTDWPAWQLNSHITSMICEAGQTLRKEVDE